MIRRIITVGSSLHFIALVPGSPLMTMMAMVPVRHLITIEPPLEAINYEPERAPRRGGAGLATLRLDLERHTHSFNNEDNDELLDDGGAYEDVHVACQCVKGGMRVGSERATASTRRFSPGSADETWTPTIAVVRTRSTKPRDCEPDTGLRQGRDLVYARLGVVAARVGTTDSTENRAHDHEGLYEF
ncbi:hypothetical protein O1611_g9635 [Lasiodiplodia mahajangana]|uniref:Uncharacterized protein n=1 Tax=Lasiodiplodia mahajangana TaxID=1108764 RepID=A0ACC2J726_9PEZI|nr:hypothetical protein O1611_g9635 [Lasiodiplodia mahajangana]